MWELCCVTLMSETYEWPYVSPLFLLLSLQSLNTVADLVAWMHLAQKGASESWGSKAAASPAYADLVVSMWGASPQVWGVEGLSLVRGCIDVGASGVWGVEQGSSRVKSASRV